MMNEITFEIPKGASPAKCRGCQQKIFWVRMTSEKNMPVNPDGTSHFSNCPKADKFRKYDPTKDPRRKTQATALEKIGRVEYRLCNWEKNFVQSMRVKIQNAKELTKSEDSALMKIEHDHCG